MPASRWNTNLFELLSWVGEDDHTIDDDEKTLLRDFMFKSIPTHIIHKDNQESEFNPGDGQFPIENIPSILPILPLRGLVVYPQTAVPLTIGQPRSIRLIDDVVSSDERLIGVVTSRDPDLEMPGPQDLYTVGTVAMVHRLFRAPDGTIRLLIQGLGRFQLGDFIQTEPYLKANIQLSPEPSKKGWRS
jgi:ATP-dependent Lon protease